MSRISNIRYWFRYYFVRKKAPLSWIFWGQMLHRETVSQGMYPINIASASDPDCAIDISMGAPRDNRISICIYDAKGGLVETIQIPLSYRSMKRVFAGFDKASSVSRKIIKAEIAASQSEPTKPSKEER